MGPNSETPTAADGASKPADQVAAPWASSAAGYLRDERLCDAWREAIEANRRKLEEDPDAI
jgi:hypothetical protein